MKKRLNILVGVFLLLLAISIGEIIYYFVILAPKTDNEMAPDTTISNDQLQAQPYVTNQGISPVTISYLQNLNKEVLTSSYLTNEQQGEIASIILENGKITINNQSVEYALIMDLKINEQLKQRYFYNNKEVGILQILSENGDMLTLNDLKNGDSIKIYEKINLLKPFSEGLEEFIITRLSP